MAWCGTCVVMGGQCGYIFKREDPETWGPDWEYWQECHEEYKKRGELVKRQLYIWKAIDRLANRSDEVERAKKEAEDLMERIRRLPSEDIPVLSDNEVFDEEEWKCPHPEHNESGRCVFHLCPDEKKGLNETEAFLTALETSSRTDDPNYARFLGAHIWSIDINLQDRQLGADLPEGTVIDFSCSRFESLGSFSGNAVTPLVVSAPFRASIVSNTGLSFECTRFERTVSMSFSQFRRSISDGDDLDAPIVSFQKTTFESSAAFSQVGFTGDLAGSFEDVEFLGERAGNFEGAEFSGTGVGNFGGTKFSGMEAGSFQNAHFSRGRSDSRTSSTFIRGEAGNFRSAEFSGEGAGDFAGTEFTGTGVGVFWNTQFSGIRAGSFQNAQFNGDRSEYLVDAIFSREGVGSFYSAEFSGEQAGNFAGADFSGEWSGFFQDVNFSGERAGYFSRVEFSGEDAGYFSGAQFSGKQSGVFYDVSFSGEWAGFFQDAEFCGLRSGDFRDSKFKANKAGSFRGVRFAGAYAGLFGTSNSTEVPLASDEVSEVNATFDGPNTGDFTQVISQGDHAGNFHNVQFIGEGSGIFTGAEFRRPNFTGVHYGPLDEPEYMSKDSVNKFQPDSGGTDTPLGESISFLDVRFEDAKFAGATFKRPISFKRARFRGDTVFNGATFENQAKFEEASFGGVTFRDAMFGGKTTFDDVIFTDNVSFVGTDDDRTPRFGGESPPSFQRTEFRQRVDFSRCGYLRGTSFRDATLSWADFTGVDLTDVNFSGADLTGSTLDGASIERVRFENTVLESVNVDSETFRDGGGYVCCYDPTKPTSVEGTTNASEETDDGTCSPELDSETAAMVYQKLESVARANTLPRAVGQLFVARKRVERHQYFEQMRDPARSPSDRLYWFSLWTRSWAANLVLYYGESPWRVILTSASIILFCALLYPFGLMRPTGGDPILYSTDPNQWLPAFFDGLYVSVLTFTTASFGQYQPVGYGRLLSTAEATSGLVLFALLIFVFGRRATR